MVSYPSGFSKIAMKKILPMSIISTLSSNQSSSSIHPAHLTKDETLQISQNSHLFEPNDSSSDNNSEDIFHRLCQQKSRLLRLYDLEIDRRQTTSQLVAFISKIEQLIDEYEGQLSNNLLIGNSI